MEQIKQGQLLQADFFDNIGGLNLTDTPFRVQDNQAVGGQNFDLTVTGGFKKRFAHTQANSTPDAQLRSFAFGLHTNTFGTKTIMRWAGTKIQTVDGTTFACTNQTEDTTAVNSNFLNSASTVPAQLIQFNNGIANVNWGAGAGASAIWGYTGTKVTKNGVPAPTYSSFTATPSAGGTPGAPGPGDFWYTLVYHKNSTDTIGNPAIDVKATVTAGDKVDLSWTLTNNDTTKYNQIYIYRSALDGVSGFTTGDLIAIVASSATTYTDQWAAVVTEATNVPRPGNIVLDNSTLPSGSPTVLTLFKRRLVTAIGSTVYLSDVNKPESWPLTNPITIPSGGNITAVAVISFSTTTSTGTDEFLAIFKERELWIITGTDYTDFELKFIDYTGCLSNPSIVFANGFLAWPDYRGIYLWDGSSKPIYTSRPIEFQWSLDGDLDRSKLPMCVGTFSRKTNQIIWQFSSSLQGEQVYTIKLDLRLTLPQIQTTLLGRVIEGVFSQDITPFPLYATQSLLTTFDESVLAGDASGKIYKLYDNGVSDAGTGVSFKYQTRPLDMGTRGMTKKYHKIIVWCREQTVQNLVIRYWTNYRTDIQSANIEAQPITNNVTDSLWDQASWDAAYWDVNLNTYNPVVFNLRAVESPIEGDALTIQFEQTDTAAPVTIAGFSVLYSTLGVRK